jgi:hypothetical protein
MLPSHLYLGLLCDLLVRGFVSLLEFLIFSYFLCLISTHLFSALFLNACNLCPSVRITGQVPQTLLYDSCNYRTAFSLGYYIGDAN